MRISTKRPRPWEGGPFGRAWWLLPTNGGRFVFSEVVLGAAGSLLAAADAAESAAYSDADIAAEWPKEIKRPYPECKRVVRG